MKLIDDCIGSRVDKLREAFDNHLSDLSELEYPILIFSKGEVVLGIQKIELMAHIKIGKVA